MRETHLCAMIGDVAPIDLRIRDDGSSSLCTVWKSHSILSKWHDSHDDLLLMTGNNRDTLQSACCDKHVGDGSSSLCIVQKSHSRIRKRDDSRDDLFLTMWNDGDSLQSTRCDHHVGDQF